MQIYYIHKTWFLFHICWAGLDSANLSFCLLPILQPGFLQTSKHKAPTKLWRCILFFINKTNCIIPYYFLNAGYFFFFLKMLGFKCYILIFCPESKTLLLDSLFKAKFYIIYIFYWIVERSVVQPPEKGCHLTSFQHWRQSSAHLQFVWRQIDHRCKLNRCLRRFPMVQMLKVQNITLTLAVLSNKKLFYYCLVSQSALNLS